MYEIPKISVDVVLHLTNGDALTGSVWITDDLVSAAGNPLVEKFLNTDPDTFFSFASNAGAFRLVNKEHVTYIETDQDDSEVKSLTPLPPNTMVVHFVNSQTLYGLVYPIPPQPCRRFPALER